MAYNSLQEFVQVLEREGELKRVTYPVKAELEITEIADRVMKSGGPALLFENVVGKKIPVLINAFGSPKRMAMALGVEDVEEIARDIEKLTRMKPPGSLWDKLRMLPELARLAGIAPSVVKEGECQEVIERDPDLNILPILTCWPGDGGPFITLPTVISRDPGSGQRNVGLYRMQVFDSRTTAMHWHLHKVGARHFQRQKERKGRMELAACLGGDPALIYAATAPLPDQIDEFLFTGFLRKKRLELVKAITVDVEVPANSDIVIEGYIDPAEPLRTEGPFGDHTGFYSLADDYPVFHVTCITHKKKPIYPATIVGRPPMEDVYLGKATERIFLPLLRLTFPEIVDIDLPAHGVFHNLAIVSIKKEYPAHARKIMHGLWGLGQMMFTKIIIVVDHDVNVHDLAEVTWIAGNHIDPKRDVLFVEGPVDVLDHAAPLMGYGSKMGIDATAKWKSEGFEREWPAPIVMDEKTKKYVDSIWAKLGL
ncbi:MAG: menaquinone biosynthesis decarboxylase [Deltaproteobacteria bacterium RBG_16_55_12]|nr:MAG: menaquinone biosynthesis decarboxylase [Deltaproteobacteria bacterium RBG_16_55_12]OGQ95086.1 MAG: menaquinone biosynthesis decarboxylase [Deltaproteobacteria bacterium RIFOXYA2_FULL_55_11]